MENADPAHLAGKARPSKAVRGPIPQGKAARTAELIKVGLIVQGSVLHGVSRQDRSPRPAFPKTFPIPGSDHGPGRVIAVDSAVLFFGGFMVIRALAAAAAVVFGMGQAVQAASVGYDLRYESSVFEDVFLYDEETDESFFAEELDILNVPGYVSTLFPNALKGDIFRLQAEIGEDEDGYKASDCSIGSFDCTTYSWERLVSLDPLTIVADAFGIWSDGSQVTLTSWGRWDGDGFDLSTGDRWGRAGAITTTFTIVELAPVPLPASAALLPLGLGALAMMRRRRKPV